MSDNDDLRALLRQILRVPCATPDCGNLACSCLTSEYCYDCAMRRDGKRVGREEGGACIRREQQWKPEGGSL
jgi:hypothetical protein